MVYAKEDLVRKLVSAFLLRQTTLFVYTEAVLHGVVVHDEDEVAVAAHEDEVVVHDEDEDEAAARGEVGTQQFLFQGAAVEC